MLVTVEHICRGFQACPLPVILLRTALIVACRFPIGLYKVRHMTGSILYCVMLGQFATHSAILDDRG